MTKRTAGPTGDGKLENLIVNHTMIFMALSEEAFASIADRMGEGLAAGASAPG